MKIKFKHQAFQAHAVEAVVDCFAGQPNTSGIRYRIDPGRIKSSSGPSLQLSLVEDVGFKNDDILITDQHVLENIQSIQRKQHLPISMSLSSSAISAINLDIEMETGTGKTYCYIKTFFELNKRYGWSKFIIVVPSIAIREGAFKSLEITADHFQETYGKKAKCFIYNSKQLHELDSFSSDAGINIMVINIQAFNSSGKDNRRIYEELDDFQSRRPIDVIKANRPILVLDEPQKMEGARTLDSLREFKPLMILRYSATHKTTHNKIYRLDALDAYNQKLVKKIAVRGITVKGLTGTNAYLYLETIEISRQAPIARLEMEFKQAGGIKRQIRRIEKGHNLYDVSGGLDQYKGYVVSDINAITDTIIFTNGVELEAGDATGDIHESVLRRIQIREAIRAHFEKEQMRFQQGIKVLTLFFIDEVAKYRLYTENGEEGGEYARIFEEEYLIALNDLGLADKPAYRKYLENIPVHKTHNGYFSIDKRTKRMIDPTTGARSTEADDVDAYDLILKDKAKLLSFDEPTRFIFSHSALREGWDNPNVFVICTLKHSDNTVSRRQEVGRGMRLSVNQNGDRQDDPATVHQINVLTVVASESYKEFVKGLQKDIRDTLSERPRKATIDYFVGKEITTEQGKLIIDTATANLIYKYLIKNDYTDNDDHLTELYSTAEKEERLAPMPEALIPFQMEVVRLINTILTDAALPLPSNDRTPKINPLNDNFNKQEFKELWNRINKKAVYSVHFKSEELIKKSIYALDGYLRVAKLQYTVHKGEQADHIEIENLEAGTGFQMRDSKLHSDILSIHTAVEYDLIGKVTENVQLTRRTVARILQGIKPEIFNQFKANPENFIAEASRLINEQKATVIIERLSYDTVAETFDSDIFTTAQMRQDINASGTPLNRHIYDYAVTDSRKEREFVNELDVSSEVVVYAKLPGGFYIPTPVGNYNPDWAIAFKEGSVKHVYFVAETKGSMSTMDLRKIEATKIECARKFFQELNRKISPDQVKYDVVDSFGKLMEVVGK